MERIETSLPGVYELRPLIHRDSRGWLSETYHAEEFAKFGIKDSFVQDNHSASARGVLRGLHYQLRQPQAKLCRVIEGEALDVAVDIRTGSPHFGKWTSVRLSAAEQNQVYIPAGFAHGFLAVTETLQFLYKCSAYYVGADQYGVLWNDPSLSIVWGTANPALSEKDANNPLLQDIKEEFLPRYSRK
jgi:dTDP-4-dehydrorhamnose 3,5-epimerase